MRSDVRSPASALRPGRRLGALALLAVLVPAACSSDQAGPADALPDDGPRAEDEAPPATLTGGIVLDELNPATVLVGDSLAFGTPLPSRQAAADAFTADPEVATVTIRAVYDRADARALGEVVVLSMVGAELFDEEALAAFEVAIVRSLAGGAGTELSIAGRPVRRATAGAGGVVSFREGNLLVVVSAPTDGDAVLIATRQIEARSRGEVGSAAPFTPLPATPVGDAFVPEPTLSFTPFPPPEDEAPPDPPPLAGAAAQGRYGVVAGERRSLVWALTVDPATFPSAEALEPAMRDLAAARAAGTVAEVVEVVDRVVLASTNQDGRRSSRVFRHEGLVLVVEGSDPAQLDAVTTAWITALASQGP